MTQFDDVIRLLSENRPQASELELDRIKQRVRRRAAQPSRRRNDMKSRIAILLMLVFGITLSTTGAGLAVQGLLTTDDASVAQYGPDEGSAPGGVLPGTGGGGSAENGGGTAATGGGSLATGGRGSALQPARQVESGADSGQLPFTGFLALPVLLGGVALLSAGLVLRRRTRDEVA